MDLGSISLAGFVDEYWRRKPLLVPGGARRLLGGAMEPADFLAACDRLAQGASHLLFREAEHLAFAERIDMAEPSLAAASRALGELVAGTRAWFDGVYARDGRTLGSHFDLADAFILQQRGTKIWRLHPPDFIPERTLRRRLLNETSIDAMHMPDGAVEFRLEAGDLLYLPLLWVHWGMSLGESLSLSAALTTKIGLDCVSRDPSVGLTREGLWARAYPPEGVDDPRDLDPLPPRVRTMLAEADPAWLAPLPAIWRSPDHPELERRTREHAERHVDALARSLPIVREAWRREPVVTVATAAVDEPADPSAARASVLEELGVLLEGAAGLPNPEVDPQGLGSVRTALDHAWALRERVRRRALGRWLSVLKLALQWIDDESMGGVLATLVRAVGRMEPRARAALTEHPAVRGWTWRASEAIAFADVPRLHELLEHLPRLVLPGLVDADALADDERLPLAPSRLDTSNALQWGLVLGLERPATGPLWARHRGGALTIEGEGDALVRLERPGSGERWHATAGRVEPLVRGWPGGPVVLAHDAWIYPYFPRPERAGLVLEQHGTAAHAGALATAVEAGWRWVEEHHPDWSARIGGAIELVIAREPRTPAPPTQMVAGFAGVLATCCADPPTMGRWLLISALDRLARDVLDGLTLVEATPVETFWAWAGKGASVSERLGALLVAEWAADEGLAHDLQRSNPASLRQERALTEAGVRLVEQLVGRAAPR